jgi:hypothetical protein
VSDRMSQYQVSLRNVQNEADYEDASTRHYFIDKQELGTPVSRSLTVYVLLL